MRAFQQSDCPSGKVSYPHKKRARHAVEVLHQHHRYGKRWRAYRCRLCGRWHLTTQASQGVSVGR